ncbi:hypothetical protein [uncultured Lactobacillus sp.]|uniref:hypothetical protein n=1 Tax=uncultured Lactobacillus sp. TaxID=153152 RepID=UPI0025E8BF91|nr:hypothetical protein [uncultured Lactobacillus sp.]
MERKITLMERILSTWQHFLDTYTDVHLTTRKSLIISLLIAIVGLVGAIYVLDLPEFLPGT